MAERENVKMLEIRVAAPDGPFDDLVKELRAILTFPRRPGFGGCDPCKSGLDRLVIEDPAFRNLGR